MFSFESEQQQKLLMRELHTNRTQPNMVVLRKF